ncbi:hypothetical protein D929_02218 [Enterococcus faecalis 02-MB-P-10]|uniref:hypothetical protein n=1 Tax=Enterococcus faecalis TaxID=1351 RepID=UPI000352E180|nr:hypothetical protein [Enterococcus faecalis]EPH71004.1 hypothetical protein D929_02218 [Enterococcus faecalis 02-MB-P-10]
MNFYVLTEPYFALIAAKAKEDCLKVYTEAVTDMEDKETLYAEMKAIDKYEALKVVAESNIEDGGKVGIEEAYSQLENLNGDSELLVIDGGLL